MAAKGSGNASQRQCLGHEGTGSVFDVRAAETQVKGSVLATKAVGLQGIGSVLDVKAAANTSHRRGFSPLMSSADSSALDVDVGAEGAADSPCSKARTVLRTDGPDHLGLWSTWTSAQMALITSGFASAARGEAEDADRNRGRHGEADVGLGRVRCALPTPCGQTLCAINPHPRPHPRPCQGTTSDVLMLVLVLVLVLLSPGHSLTFPPFDVSGDRGTRPKAGRHHPG